MSTFRKHYPSRPYIDYSIATSEREVKYLLCLTEPGIQIIRKLVSTYGHYRTTFVTSYLDDGYSVPDDNQWDVLSDVIAELEGNLMALTCMDDLVNAIGEIATGVENLVDVNATCCGESGSGGVSPETPAYDWTDTGSNVPPGFADRAEFDQTKCDAAQYLVNQLEQDINWMVQLNVAAGVTLGVLGAGLVIPGVNLVLLLGWLTSALALGILATDIAAVKDWVDEENDNILCNLVGATSASGSKSSIDAYIAASSLSSSQQNYLTYLFSQAAINRLYDSEASVPNLNADCSACVCEAYQITLGSLVSDTANSVTISPGSPNANIDRSSFQLNHNGTDFCAEPRDGVYVSVGSGYRTGSNETSADLYLSIDGGTDINIAEQPPGPWTAGPYDNVLAGYVSGDKSGNWDVEVSW